MLFSRAIAGEPLRNTAGPDVDVLRVVHDSRRVGPQAIFLAMRGESSDGNRFLDSAIAAGCAAVVTDNSDVYRALSVTHPGLAVAECEHGRRTLAGIAANLTGHPERKLKLTGVTGTNGKTTTAFLLESILRADNRKTLLLGTIEIHLAGQVLAAEHTTPEADDLYGLLAQAVANGVDEAVMEVSSHGLEQGRVWGLPYEVAVFTNLTQDHLDFHGTMDAYFAAKQKLFVEGGTGAGAPRMAVINIDDEYGRMLAQQLQASSTTLVTYGMSAGDCHAEQLQFIATGSRFLLCSPAGRVQIETALAGRVNVGNILAAAAAAQARGVSLETIAAGVRALSMVPGRFQQVQCGQPFAVVVDYAHTDDALRNLTRMARELVQGSGRVITLFGCGGDRDRTKRPLMAKAAAENSDLIILTSDNPRSEDPQAILKDAEAGLAGARTDYRIVADRAEAIREAIAHARDGDIVLLAGKGHEKTQTLRSGVVPFDDVEVARRVLKELQPWS
jgi:UDP-N-acetylmuramoyl-L-alanyl-D-glutamate--2,6-diaminopimelate ligase